MGWFFKHYKVEFEGTLNDNTTFQGRAPLQTTPFSNPREIIPSLKEEFEEQFNCKVKTLRITSMIQVN